MNDPNAPMSMPEGLMTSGENIGLPNRVQSPGVGGLPASFAPMSVAPGMGMGPETPAEQPVGEPVSETRKQGGLFDKPEDQAWADLMFEDYFPKIELTEEEESDLAEWFDKDLKSAVKNVRSKIDDWAMYRAVYALAYIELFYPDTGNGANFASGLLCEKVLEGMDRMKKSVLKARPLFTPDWKRTNMSGSTDLLHRMQWFMDTVLHDELKIEQVIDDVGFFEFVIDGSMILEADTVFDMVPERTIKIYTSIEDLVKDKDKLVDPEQYDDLMVAIGTGQPARALVEVNTIESKGLKIFRVDKSDHLIPEGVYSDADIKFRARRLYLTANDLRRLSSDDVGWYDKDKVEAVLNTRGLRQDLKGRVAPTVEGAKIVAEQLREMEVNSELFYDTSTDDSNLNAKKGDSPYLDVFAVYRVTCKYGYSTGSDPQGTIPKYCVFDYSPEGRKILRSATYPHFKERPNWFHFKFGYMPKSYWGFGYGARLLQEDFLESNAVNLYLLASSLATFKPFIARHPEAGGRGNPFVTGMGAGKCGYTNDPATDFRELDIRPPPPGILSMILPLTQTRAANRTSITSLIQGRTESSDPRSPAAKTAMLLEQANVGLDVMVDDWNTKGWQPMAQFIWNALYEIAVFMRTKGVDVKDIYSGLLVDDGVNVEGDDNKIKWSELQTDVVWSSLASASLLNPELRKERFIQATTILMPLMEKLAMINPNVYKKYFVRWLRMLALEIDVPGFKFLIPTEQEVMQMPPADISNYMQTVMKGVKSGAVPGIQQPTGGGMEMTNGNAPAGQ